MIDDKVPAQHLSMRPLNPLTLGILHACHNKQLSEGTSLLILDFPFKYLLDKNNNEGYISLPPGDTGEKGEIWSKLSYWFLMSFLAPLGSC